MKRQFQILVVALLIFFIVLGLIFFSKRKIASIESQILKIEDSISEVESKLKPLPIRVDLLKRLSSIQFDSSVYNQSKENVPLLYTLVSDTAGRQAYIPNDLFPENSDSSVKNIHFYPTGYPQSKTKSRMYSPSYFRQGVTVSFDYSLPRGDTLRIHLYYSQYPDVISLGSKAPMKEIILFRSGRNTLKYDIKLPEYYYGFYHCYVFGSNYHFYGSSIFEIKDPPTKGKDTTLYFVDSVEGVRNILQKLSR